jgi:hypothetical protein
MIALHRLNALRREADRLNAMRADLPALTWRDVRRSTSTPQFYRPPNARTIAAEKDAVAHWREAWRARGGWYADPEQLTVYTPIVYRLPHGLVWPGYVEGDTDYVVLDDEPCDDETAARHRAEQMAEHAAEEEYAYQERERERADLEDDIEDTTDTLRALLAERRTLMRYARGDADVAKLARRKADTIRATITMLRRSRRELTRYKD